MASLDYSVSKTHELQKQLVVQIAPMVKFVVGRLRMYTGFYLPQSTLIDWGIHSGIRAIDAYSPSVSVDFETYVQAQIREDVRSRLKALLTTDLIVRSRLFEEMYREQIDLSGRVPTESELLAVSPDTDLEGLYRAVLLVSWCNVDSPSMIKDKAALTGKLIDSIGGLSETERNILTLYYYETLTLPEICSVLDLAEDKVLYLFSVSVMKLRTNLGDKAGATVLLNSSI